MAGIERSTSPADSGAVVHCLGRATTRASLNANREMARPTSGGWGVPRRPGNPRKGIPRSPSGRRIRCSRAGRLVPVVKRAGARCTISSCLGRPQFVAQARARHASTDERPVTLRACGTCRFYEPSGIWRQGWCRNARLYGPQESHPVDAGTLDCENAASEGPLGARGRPEQQFRATAPSRIVLARRPQPSAPVGAQGPLGVR